MRRRPTIPFSFTAVMDLDLSRAVGHADSPSGSSGDAVRYTDIAGSIEVSLGGVAWSFTPAALIIRNDVVNDAGQPSDVWLLQAAGPDGLFLFVDLLQRDGSAIDDAHLFVPQTTDAFGSARWNLFAPSFDPKTGQQLPRLDRIAGGPIAGWAAASQGTGEAGFRVESGHRDVNAGP